MLKTLSGKYANVTREYIELYCSLCQECNLKKKKIRKSLVVKPIVSNEFNSRCQVDLIDWQSSPDGDFKWIMVYQDHLTKFIELRPLKSKRACEVAHKLLDVFLDKGAPHILQSDNGREFCNEIISELLSMWPDCRMIHGKPRHSQSQGSVERANDDIQNMLTCWMRDNKSRKWSEGLPFVKFQKNTRFHSGINRSPYEAMFGAKPKIGLSSTNLPREVLEKLRDEDDLRRVFNTENNGEGEAGPVVDVPSDTCESCSVDLSNIASCSTAAESTSLCEQCRRAREIEAHRTGAEKRQREQASLMVERSEKRFKPAILGQTVVVPIPDCDKGKGDPRNVMAVVLDIDDGGFHKLGTSNGALKSVYARNQFTPCTENFISTSEVPPDKEISLREAAGKESMLGGQGFVRCICVTKCQNGRCKCKRLGLLCGSKCHSGISCCNK